jgi:hypothetical protein
VRLILQIQYTYNALNKILPTAIVGFAAAARIHDGFRLLMHCIVLHAVNPQTRALLKAGGFIVDYKGSASFLINQEIKASMKKDIYTGSVCFYTDSIVACSCNCQAGGYK